jgi:hypothetical protein
LFFSGAYDIMALLEDRIRLQDPEKGREIMQRGLTFGDGFMFGCGFITAWILVAIVVSILSVLISLVFGAGLAGILGRMGGLGPQSWLGLSFV